MLRQECHAIAEISEKLENVLVEFLSSSNTIQIIPHFWRLQVVKLNTFSLVFLIRETFSPHHCFRLNKRFNILTVLIFMSKPSISKPFKILAPQNFPSKLTPQISQFYTLNKGGFAVFIRCNDYKERSEERAGTLTTSFALK